MQRGLKEEEVSKVAELLKRMDIAQVIEYFNRIRGFVEITRVPPENATLTKPKK